MSLKTLASHPKKYKIEKTRSLYSGLFFWVFEKIVDKKVYYVYNCITPLIQFLEVTPLEWKLNKSLPLIPQLSERICLAVACGEFKADERMFSVREVAVLSGINPNTAQHAFEVLEDQGVLYSVRGSGWFVSEDISAAKEVLSHIREEKTRAFFESMEALGLSASETKEYIKEWYHE